MNFSEDWDVDILYLFTKFELDRWANKGDQISDKEKGNTNMHTYTPTHTHIYMNTHTQIHTHTHQQTKTHTE